MACAWRRDEAGSAASMESVDDFENDDGVIGW